MQKGEMLSYQDSFISGTSKLPVQHAQYRIKFIFSTGLYHGLIGTGYRYVDVVIKIDFLLLDSISVYLNN